MLSESLRRLVLLGTALLLAMVAGGSTLSAADSAWFEVATASITDHELKGHAQFLADDTLEGREAGSRGGHAAARYIVKYLEGTTLQPAGTQGSFFQPFRASYRNILAVLPGGDPELSAEYILVGAHYDHVGYGNRANSNGPWGYVHNGADDNASGVAALLELIDAMTRTDYRPRRSVVFAFWDGEEKGLLGSAYWAKQPTVPLHQVKLSINVDMVGRMSDGRIEVGGTRTARGLRRQLSSTRLHQEWLDFSWEYKENSDHWTFYQARIPSIFLHTGVHDDYHRPSDDAEKLNVNGIRLITGYLLEKVAQFADADSLPTFRRESSMDTPFVRKRAERRLPPLASRLPFHWEPMADHPRVAHVSRVVDPRCELRAGDRIVAVNGLELSGGGMLEAVALRADAPLIVTVDRDGVEKSIEIAVELTGPPIHLGLSWREDTAEPHTVYVTRIVPHSPAARAGFQVHDRIYSIEGASFADRDDLLQRVQALLADGATSIRFEVETRGVIHQINVPMTPAHDPGADATL